MLEDQNKKLHGLRPIQKSLAVVAVSVAAACSSMNDSPKGYMLQGSAQPEIRPPAVGQHWVYEVRDLFTNKIVDEVTETVAAVKPNIIIRRVSQKMGPLPDDVQSQWGMVVQDSHWKTPIVFSEPLPEWPTDFSAPHSTNYSARYALLNKPDWKYSWRMTMTPHDWESISVPTGKFKTFYFTDAVNYDTPDSYYRIENERLERVWFAPEVGRWVLRRSEMQYQTESEGGDFRGRALQWELKEWS